MKGGGNDMETHESIGQIGKLMRLHDGTPVSVTVVDSVYEMDSRVGQRRRSSVNFTPRLNQEPIVGTPIEIPVGKGKSEYFKVTGKAMKGQEFPDVFVEPINQNEFDSLSSSKTAVKPDNLDQLPKV